MKTINIDRAEVRRRWRRFVALVGWPILGGWLVWLLALVALLIWKG